MCFLPADASFTTLPENKLDHFDVSHNIKNPILFGRLLLINSLSL